MKIFEKENINNIYMLCMTFTNIPKFFTLRDHRFHRI
jgi:hypothetical protein